MKKTIGILSACLLFSACALAAEPEAAWHAQGAITADVLAEATAKLNSPEPEAVEKQEETQPAEAQNEESEAQAQNQNEQTNTPAQQAAANGTAPVKNAQNVKTVPAAQTNGQTAQQVQTKQPRVVHKTVKITPPQENWYLTKPNDFAYHINKERPNYSIAVPYAFGSDLLAGLPAEGTMLVRGADDATAMTFNAAPGGDAPAVFKAALAGKQLQAPPAPVTRYLKENGEEIMEITQFEAPPQYSYVQVDTTPLKLPAQLEDLILTEAGEYKTFQGLNSQYMQFSCTSAGVPCLLRLTLTEYSGYQYTGFYLFPQSRRLTFIPLASYSARSLQCGSQSIFNKY